jgi:hypothetical protein
LREYVKRQLAAMEGLEDRAMFRDILEQLFLGLTDHYEGLYADLERRIRDEIPAPLARFVIATGAVESKSLDPERGFLRPMDDADCPAPGPAEAKEALAALAEGREWPVGIIFLEMDDLDCRELAGDGGRFFRGVVIGETGERRPARFRARSAAGRYMSRVERLYQLFLDNHLPWQTVNAPYLRKFFDVTLAEAPAGGLPEGRLRFEVDWESYGPWVRRDILPVWNVSRCQAKGDEFPRPAGDTPLYEYQFSMARLGEGNGYLMDGSQIEIASVRWEDEAVVIVSPERRDLRWDIYVVHPPRESRTDDFTYPLMTNRRLDSYAGRLAAWYGAGVKTRAELERELLSFPDCGAIRLKGCSVTDQVGDSETYEMDPFLRDEIREPGSRRALSLLFAAGRPGYFLNRDIMSFLTSQAQRMFPEYRCAGTSIK